MLSKAALGLAEGEIEGEALILNDGELEMLDDGLGLDEGL